MPTVIVPHRDTAKAGATEHVDAIVKALRTADTGLTISAPIENEYEGKVLLSQAGQARAIHERHGEANYIVVTGDYGTNRTERDLAYQEIRDGLSPSRVTTLMSTYTAESRAIIDEFSHGCLDYVAVPAHAIAPGVLDDAEAESVIAYRQLDGKVIETVGVPHLVTRDLCTAKRGEWINAAIDDKVQPLPRLMPQDQLAIVILPGDVENKDGEPRLFTGADAERLADAIAEQLPTDVRVLLSNGPRTGKYNETLFGAQDFEASNPAFQNNRRTDGIGSNPVAYAFYKQLADHIGEDRIVDGCIAKGLVPAQGFLAFYDLANEHAARGGSVAAYIDGVSTTMLAQAANVLHPNVSIVATDTPAKTRTHEAGMDDLFARGQVSVLRLQDGLYSLQLNDHNRTQSPPFDDAQAVAARIVDIVDGHEGPMVVRRPEGRANWYGTRFAPR